MPPPRLLLCFVLGLLLPARAQEPLHETAPVSTASALSAPETASAAASPTPAGQTETLVFFRHGEKPPSDSGQLSPRGLNRALALPAVLAAKFGRPGYLFAPGTKKKTNKEGTFSYVRPLATIEPTAIQLGLPVETRYQYQDVGGLEKELADARYRAATVFIVWEHKELVTMVRELVAALGGKADEVPAWEGTDFDSLYVVKVHTAGDGARQAAFTLDHEGLDGQSDEFPEARRK